MDRPRVQSASVRAIMSRVFRPRSADRSGRPLHGERLVSAEPRSLFEMSGQPSTAIEQGQRWLELWSEYEVTRNEVIGVIENTSALGEEQSRAMLAMAKDRRAQAEEALVRFSRTVMSDDARNAPSGSRRG